MTNLERPNFFSGKLLSAEDLALEQNYTIQKRQLHNRFLHGWGVVSGLKVVAGKSEIVISPGYALDCEGNEIVVINDIHLPVPATSVSGNTAYVALTFRENGIEAVTPASRQPNWNKIAETCEAGIFIHNANSGHRRVGGRWMCCGLRHATAIARLRRTTVRWRVDRSYRPPTIR